MVTAIFLVTKFSVGAWSRCYYQQAGRLLGPGSIPGKPRAEPAVVITVAGVWRLAQRAISEALSISDKVIAVTVLTGGDSQNTDRDDEPRKRARWNPGPPLHVLHTEYASMAGPIFAILDRLSEQHTEQIVVLIPVAIPGGLRYRFLHDYADRALIAALRSRPDIVTARVPVPLHLPGRQHDTSTRYPVPTPDRADGTQAGSAALGQGLMAGTGFSVSPGDSTCCVSAILARAQRRDVRPNIWASFRSDSGLPACTLSRYAVTAASLTAPASGPSSCRCPLVWLVGCPPA